MSSDISYVYVYLDPRKGGTFIYNDLEFDYEPFYVGKGKKDRCYFHLYEYENYPNKYKTNKIKKIHRLGYEIPIIKIKENISDQEAKDYEIYCIKVIGRKCNSGPLVNMTDGGEGTEGFKHSDDSKKKMSARQKELYLHGYINPTLGMKRDELSERNKATKGFIWIYKADHCKQVPPDEAEEYLNDGWIRGQKDIKYKKRYKNVINQYKDGVLINTFLSLKEAFRSIETPEYGYDEMWLRTKREEEFSGYIWKKEQSTTIEIKRSSYKTYKDVLLK